MKTPRFVLLVLCALAALSGAGPANADTVIKVIVNGLPVTSYDIEQRVALNELTGRPGGTKEATEELINEAIQRTEASRVGLTIPDAQIDAGFATIAGRVRLTPEQLTQALTGRGISPSTLKTQIRAQMIWQELAQDHIRRAAKVKSSDVSAALLAKGDNDKLTINQYTLQQIIFVLPKNPSEELISQRRRDAEQFRARFAGCDKSVDLAKSFKDVAVKDTGRRDSTQLSGALGDAIKKTRAGGLTDVSPTNQGLEMYAVCKIAQVQSTSGARAEIENRLLVAQSEDIGKDYLKELRARAVIVYK
ncbi:MAG: SurA N-terminal domain-containing protein [Bauldia sp.]